MASHSAQSNCSYGWYMSKSLTIQLHKQAMLSGGSVLVLHPFLAIGLGGVAEALVYKQLHFRAGGYTDEYETHTARFSYTRLQKQFPFFTRRWIIEIIRSLEKKGAISVIRSSRVNVYTVNGEYDLVQELTPQNSATMLVFPELACRIGLMEAVALQQIHIRNNCSDGSCWVIRSLKQWHSDVFMFSSIATVKRLFSKLAKKNLIYVKPYHGEEGTVNSYRVNYVELASILEIPLPEVKLPKPNGWSDEYWTNPLYPFKAQKVSSLHQHVSNVH